MSLDLIALFEKGPPLDEVKSDENENEKNENQNDTTTTAAAAAVVEAASVIQNGDIPASEEDKLIPLSESLVYNRQESLQYNDITDTYISVPVITKAATTGGNRFSKVRIECEKDKRKNSKFKVESYEDGRNNLDLNHLSVDSPDIKGYPHDESPGGSIKAGSEVDFEIDREDEKFASLRRTYSRSSIASAVANFKDQIKGTLAGDMAKGKADANTRLKIAVLIFFSICFGIVVTSHILYSQQVGEVQLFSNMKLLEEERRIVIDIPGNSGLAADLGVNIPYHLHPYDCLPGVHHNESTVELSPFVTGDEDQTEWGNVIKRYFINSQGVSIKVSDETPLSVSMSAESGLCLKAHYDEFPYYYHKEGYPQLNYTVCSNENLLTLYEKQLTRSFWDGHKESDLKELNRLLKLPLWQLPAPQNGEPLNSEHVSNYIKMIVGRSAPVSRGEPRGYLLIDSSWQQNMGDLVLSDRLRDLEKTVSGYGLTLVLTLTPFVSTDSISFNEGVEKGLFVMERKLNITRDIPALTWYKNVPAAALLDITNNNTKSWLKGKLREVVKAMPSVVFFVETGNAFHTPHYFEFQTDLYNPDLYKDLLISVAMTEIKVVGVSGASARRPKAPAFVHLTPLASNWDSLRTIIPNILNLGVIGYPFVSAGPVGGDFTKNGTIQTSRTSSNEEVPDPELFIRWWQLATFMPQVHFTTPPTQYRNKHIHTVTQNLKYIKEEVVNPELIMFSQVAMENSAPVIRPLWMLDPEDEVAQTISDEFLIGDKILVAPVLEQGATTRNVYLPHSKKGPGVWKRGSDGTFFEGGQWLNNSLAPLDTVLYFIRQSDFARPGSDLS